MPSFTTISAAAVLAFSGMASAIPAYTYSNGTSYNATSPSYNSTTSAQNGTTSVSSGSNSTDSAFCPKLDLQVYTDSLGFSFFIECNTNHFGTQIDIEVSVAKRAAPTSLGDCLTQCDAVSTCVGTAFNSELQTCTLYSDVEASYTDDNTDFAIRIANPSSGSTVSAGQQVTSTLFSTTVETILSCAPTVTNCPLRSGAVGVVTQVIPVSETTYICPAATTVPAAPIACTACPYSATTATVYTSTGGSFVAVATEAVNYPVPTGTTITVTSCPASDVSSYASTAASTAVASVPAVATIPVTYNSNNANSNGTASLATGSNSNGTAYTATASSTMAIYTGAAGQVKAGMGMAVIMMGAALVL